MKLLFPNKFLGCFSQYSPHILDEAPEIQSKVTQLVAELDLNSKGPTMYAIQAALSATVTSYTEKSDTDTGTASVTSRRVRPAKGNGQVLG